MKIKELGCAGHFICASSCLYRRHTQVGDWYRVSTVGDYYLNDKRQTIGAGKKDYFETYVFRTNGRPAKGSDGCGCIEVVSWSEIDGSRWESVKEAANGHDEFVQKYSKMPKWEDDEHPDRLD